MALLVSTVTGICACVLHYMEPLLTAKESTCVCLCEHVHLSFLLYGVDSLFLKKGVNHLQGHKIMQAAANLTQG